MPPEQFSPGKPREHDRLLRVIRRVAIQAVGNLYIGNVFGSCLHAVLGILDFFHALASIIYRRLGVNLPQVDNSGVRLEERLYELLGAQGAKLHIGIRHR